jgi:hypothetical protein
MMFKRLLVIPAILLFQSCIFIGLVDPEPEPNSATDFFEPILMTREEFENSVGYGQPIPIDKAGKIYVKDHIVLINELHKGFHVYNYQNPENPQAIGFIKVPGATDVAIRADMIYINQAVDLLSISYNNTLTSIQVQHRNKNVFPQMNQSPSGQFHSAPNGYIIVGYQSVP